ncbi:MAG: hypothetical protein M3R36_01935 [Bacteroidota bacterium]|nr:hypothetical protein [Bacteroidota bacterium]
MKEVRNHGIGFFVDKARVNHNAFDEFVTSADSYFHYSNNILFELNRSVTALCLLMFIIDRTGSIIQVLIIPLKETQYHQYPGFKDNAKIFEGVIERYCGVPP